MHHLINILILIFLLLISYQFIYTISYREGLTSTNGTAFIPYDPNNPTSPNSANNAALTLAQQNSQHIIYLNNQFSELLSQQKEINDISLNVISLNQQVAGLLKQQAGFVSSVGSNGKPNLQSATQQENAYTASNS